METFSLAACCVSGHASGGAYHLMMIGDNEFLEWEASPFSGMLLRLWWETELGAAAWPLAVGSHITVICI